MLSFSVLAYVVAYFLTTIIYASVTSIALVLKSVGSNFEVR